MFRVALKDVTKIYPGDVLADYAAADLPASGAGLKGSCP